VYLLGQRWANLLNVVGPQTGVAFIASVFSYRPKEGLIHIFFLPFSFTNGSNYSCIRLESHSLNTTAIDPNTVLLFPKPEILRSYLNGKVAAAGLEN
jgi:hypothetical protein